MPKIIDLSGKTFGRLTAIKKVGINKQGNNLWLCKCECGNEKEVIASNLTRGQTKSCGCAIHTGEFSRVHGMGHSRINRIWNNMKTRCYNPKAHEYKNYGGRGIKVCDRWTESFKNFYEDMKDAYLDGLTLERINVDGDYEPGNCKWATVIEQGNNRRGNILFTINETTDTLRNLCNKFNKEYKLVKSRIKQGMDIEKAFNQQKRVRR